MPAFYFPKYFTSSFEILNSISNFFQFRKIFRNLSNFDSIFRSSGIQEDGDMDGNNSRSSLNLRPTLSLPSVTPTYPPQSLLISPQLPPSHR